MTEHFKFDAGYSLVDLQQQLTEYQGLNGPLVGIGNQAGTTIGSFDEDGDGEGSIELRPGKPLRIPPGVVIDTDIVFVTGQMQTVTAYSVPPAQ